MECEQPQSLLECASQMVGSIITRSAVDIFHQYKQAESISAENRNDLELLITKIAEEFDTLIPKPLHNIIMQHTLESLPNDFCFMVHSCKIKLNYFDIVFRSHATRFDINDWQNGMQKVIYSSLKRLKNLQCLRLEMFETSLKENLIHVTTAMKDMKKLHSFECYGCCDEIVKVLCENCPLRKLVIRFSGHVTDLSLPYILSLQNLEELDISYCGFSKESEFEILSGLPHLKTISAKYLDEFLAEINDDSIILPFQSVKSFNCRSENSVVNLTKYCPLITKLEIRGRSPGNLSGLAALSHLKELKVYNNLKYYDEIRPFLESNGHQLIELNLNIFRDTAAIVNDIKILCPNLKNLILNGFRLNEAYY